MHSTSVNSSRITFAASSGAYHVGANIDFNPMSSAQTLIVRILLNDVTPLGGNVCFQSAAAADFPISVATTLNATSTSDYVTVQVFTAGPSTGSISAGLNYGTSFWAHKI
jgi:hypothetical protein